MCPPVIKQPVFIVIAGPNGSGKSTLASSLQVHEWGRNAEFINADLIARELGDWNDPECVRKAQQECRVRLERAMSEGCDIMYESVFSHDSKIDLVKNAVKAGYFCRFFFVGTASPSINIERVSIRVSENGHDVPLDKIESRFQRSFLNSAAAMRIVQRGYCYDNSRTVDENADFPIKPLFRTVNGRKEKEYLNPEEWNPIFRSFLRNVCDS